MKIKIDELKGSALDWVVANYENVKYDGEVWSPSTKWEHGGKILEREKISISFEDGSWAAWSQSPFRDAADFFGYGQTPLLAAMRCYVASKLKDQYELEVPEDFLK